MTFYMGHVRMKRTHTHTHTQTKNKPTIEYNRWRNRKSSALCCLVLVPPLSGGRRVEGGGRPRPSRASRRPFRSQSNDFPFRIPKRFQTAAEPVNGSLKMRSISILCVAAMPVATVAPAARPEYPILRPHIFSKRGFTNDQAPMLRCSSCDQTNSKTATHTTRPVSERGRHKNRRGKHTKCNSMLCRAFHRSVLFFVNDLSL